VNLGQDEAFAGSVITVTGSGFQPDKIVDIRWGSVGGPVLGYKTINSGGTFTGKVTVPRTATRGTQQVWAVERNTSTGPSVSLTVIGVDVTVSPTEGVPGTILTVTGTRFQPGEKVEIRWNTAGGTLLGYKTASTSGSISGKVTIPASAAPGTATIVLSQPTSGRTGSTSITVSVPVVPTATVNPAVAKRGTVITVTGTGFKPDEVVEIRWNTPTGTLLGYKTASSSGGISGKVTVPASAASGNATIVLRERASGTTASARITIEVPAVTTPYLKVSQSTVQPGMVISVSGGGMMPGQQVELRWNSQGGQLLGRVTARADGTFSGRITIPATATSGTGRVYAVSATRSTSTQVTVAATARMTTATTTKVTPTPTATATPVGTPGATPGASPTPVPTGTPTMVPTNEPVGTPTVEPTVEPTPEPTVAPTPTPALYPEGITVMDQHGTPVPDVCIVLRGPNNEVIAEACDATHDGASDGRVLFLSGIEAGEYRIELANLPADIDPFTPQHQYLDGADGIDVRITVVRQQPTPVPTPTPEPTPEPTPVPTPTPEPIVVPPEEVMPDPAGDPASTPAA
jgi:hypothetical protein